MVKKASRAIKAEGADKAYTENTFVDRDLYIVVCGLDGLVLAHGANKGRIDTNQIDDKDADVKAVVASGSTRRQSAATHTSRSPGDLEEKNCDRVCL
jgi:hypothetical protein